MSKEFTFDNMINTMMPLPFSGSANGQGIYCRGQELVAKMENAPKTDYEDIDEGFNLNGIFSQYCTNM